MSERSTSASTLLRILIQQLSFLITCRRGSWSTRPARKVQLAFVAPRQTAAALAPAAGAWKPRALAALLADLLRPPVQLEQP